MAFRNGSFGDDAFSFVHAVPFVCHTLWQLLALYMLYGSQLTSHPYMFV